MPGKKLYNVGRAKWRISLWLVLPVMVFFALAAHGQIQLFPIAKESGSRGPTFLRTKQNKLSLPFWDDFAYADSLQSPADSLWQFSQSTWTNTGMGIDPPSLGVSTFDGLDSLGKTYSVNDVLAKSLADKMVSQPIQLDLVDVSLRSTVYISFYYQWQGNGEPPDPGDQLTLSFKNDQGKWETIATIDNDGSLDRETFYSMILPVTGDRFFHNNFQFMFQNFSRLSGPYDTWNLDYVYLNSGRFPTDTSYPDRTVTSTLSSLFKSYRAIPRKHFFANPSGMLEKPSYFLYNLRADNDQPLNHFSNAEIISFKGGTPFVSELKLDSAQDVGGSLPGLTRKKVTLTKIPPESAFDATADSIEVTIRLRVFTKDNVPPALQGDYDIPKYSPIDFRLNDKTHGTFHLSDYYAYDDGSAEYGAGLNQPGSLLGYMFKTESALQDTIVSIDLYFPRFGDETSQSMQLQILRDFTNGPGSALYTETITVQRSDQNKFWRHKLTRPVGIESVFYVVLKQTSFAVLPIGLDKNTNTGDKMYFNTNGTWAQNTIISGSLMIRPVFGKGEGGLITGIEDRTALSSAYPNPNAGIFFISGSAEEPHLYDLAGRPVSISVTEEADRKRVELHQPAAGIYILRTREAGSIRTHKVMVRP